jgi:hypothetical protein
MAAPHHLTPITLTWQTWAFVVVVLAMLLLLSAGMSF